MSQQDIYPIEIAGVKRDLRLFEVKPGLRIAIINILGDVELVEACANELAKRLQGLAYDTILTAETKSIPIAHMLSRATGVPYVVLRKNWKPYMGDAIRAETLSITTGKPQTLILDQKDIPLIQNKRVIILDDVISTGSTLQGMKLITEKAGGEVVKEVAILTEGDPSQWRDVLALGHLPLFTD
ncbi:MAG TPA: phosphoribosyltransferase family protein [Anaerolineaceae bacterium]|nr:phosphoribosyltransferase family protein [Anaerolineaceae bacterium]